jgi:hypothetical protein
MSRRSAWTIAAAVPGAGAAVLAGVLALAGPAAAGEASIAAGGPHWRIVKSVKTNDTAAFTAVAPTGKATAWAFDGSDPATGPTAWQLKSGAWTQDKSFPKLGTATIVSAAATSPSNVWAFTQGLGGGSEVLRYNGKAWSVAAKFKAYIGGASVLAPNDVWLFGSDLFGGSGLGVWHYDGHTWKQVGKNLEGGSALSATDAWAFSGSSIFRYRGGTWKSVSVKSLLPAKQELNDPAVTGIYAVTDSDVYAIGNGNQEDDGGPAVVLHLSGGRWAKVASANAGYGSVSFGGAQVISPDGKGGFWLPMPGADSAKSYILHYAAGKLSSSPLPVAASAIAVFDIARVPGSAQQFAAGVTYKADNPGTDPAAVILQYS